MLKSFKIVEVAVVQKNHYHVPYIGYVVVMSHFGKQILIDIDNFIKLVKSADTAIKDAPYQRMIIDWAYYHGMVNHFTELDTSDFNLRLLAVNNYMSYIIGKENRLGFRRVKSNLDMTSLMDFIHSNKGVLY